MSRTGVAHEDFFSPDGVAATAIGRAWVDGMTVVDAAAYRVALDDFDAHVGCMDSLID